MNVDIIYFVAENYAMGIANVDKRHSIIVSANLDLFANDLFFIPNTRDLLARKLHFPKVYACGTGAAAAVVAAVLNGYCKPDTDVTVKVRGGDLIVKYTSDGMVTLTGSVKQVFEGEIEF